MTAFLLLLVVFLAGALTGVIVAASALTRAPSPRADPAAPDLARLLSDTVTAALRTAPHPTPPAPVLVPPPVGYGPPPSVPTSRREPAP